MKQAEKIYMISDAAKQVQVESHVLRYWEEELKLPSKRNEMGHRYYTEEDINQFCKIRELKEQGLQLKAIRNMLKNGKLYNQTTLFGKNNVEEETKVIQDEYKEDMAKRHVVMMKKGEFMPVQEESREQKSMRLQQLLKEMIIDALHSNNQELCHEIKESLLKELDYQFRLQEEREDLREEERIGRQEEHYRQVDELIRSCNQKGKREPRKTRQEMRKDKASEEKRLLKTLLGKK